MRLVASHQRLFRRALGRSTNLPAIFLAGVFLFSFATLQAQTDHAKFLSRFIDTLSMPVPDTLKAKLSIGISNYYLKLPGNIKAYKDSATTYAIKAGVFAASSGDTLTKARAYVQKSKLLLLNKNFAQGIPLFERNANFTAKNGMPKYSHDVWWWSVQNVLHEDPTFDFHLRTLESLSNYHKNINDTLGVYRVQAARADIYFKMGLLDKAETELEEALKGIEARKYTYTYQYYHQLSFIARYKGNYAKALHFSLEAIRNLVLPRDSGAARNYYVHLAELYYNVGPVERYREYMLRARTFDRPTTPFSRFMQEATIINFRDDNYQKALDIILTGAKKHPPNGLNESYNFHLSVSTLYGSLKQYALEEKHLLEVLKLEKEINRGRHMDAQYNYYNAAKLYCNWGKFEKAEPFLTMLLAIPAGRSPLGVTREAHYLQYRVDSAKGNYLSAIQHLRKFKELYDIIYATNKSWQLQEITVKYETEMKEHRLKVLADSNRLHESRMRILNDSMFAVTRQRQIEDLQNHLQLTRTVQDLRLAHASNMLNLANVQLLSDSISNKEKLQLLEDRQEQLVAAQKEQDIRLLTSGAELNKRKLADAQLRQKLIIGGIVLSLLTCAALAYFYWLKKKSNRRIETANKALKRLVEEKEWLLKEVHHRVKNNLHTVVSLLESQSAYLSDAALAAVVNSQNRVYTMSLIHQKLYTNENASSVDMSVYLPELIHYLEKSYDVQNKIRFTHDVSSVHLNGTLAVPIGLILNEAVTNAIKYAFENIRHPSVHVSLNQVDDNKVELSIADNGIGISDGAILQRTNSLGLTLIEGLTQDINGEFSIIKNNGTKISVKFSLVDNKSVQPLV